MPPLLNWGVFDMLVRLSEDSVVPRSLCLGSLTVRGSGPVWDESSIADIVSFGTWVTD